MQTYDLDHTLFSRPNAGDDSLLVVFYMGTLKDEEKSLAEGRLIVNDIECVRVVVPGDKNNIVDRPATTQDKARFHRQYGLFKQGHGEEGQVTGTPLAEWPSVSRAQVEELKYLGIRTVEQLAQVRDDIVARVPGLQQLKQHAGVYLVRAEKGAEAAKLSKKMEEQDNEIATMRESVKQQAALIEKLMKEKTNAR